MTIPAKLTLKAILAGLSGGGQREPGVVPRRAAAARAVDTQVVPDLMITAFPTFFRTSSELANLAVVRAAALPFAGRISATHWKSIFSKPCSAQKSA